MVRYMKPEDIRTRYIKYWLISVLLFGIIMILIQIIINRSYPEFTNSDLLEYKYMVDHTPDYPPPLFNFMDEIIGSSNK